MNKIDLFRRTQLHRLFRPFFAGCGNVLVFHRVENNNSSLFYKNNVVSPDYLESVIQYFISNNIDIVSLDECYERITSKYKSNRFVAFTFDDGWKDNLTYALPIFEKYNVPFALFLTTGYINREMVFWGYLLEDLILSKNHICFSHNGIEYSYITISMEEKINAFYQIKKILREFTKEISLTKLKGLFDLSEDEIYELTQNLMLNWEQVDELSKSPLITFGSHSISHSVLRNLSDKEVFYEIDKSVNIIEERTKRKINYFAYPFGGVAEVSTREYNIASNYGLKMAFTVSNDNLFKHHQKRLSAIPRIGLNEKWSLSHLDLFVNGFTPFMNIFK